MHIGRAFTGTDIERACPCPKAPCGLVPEEEAVPECVHHHIQHAPSIRQGHLPQHCAGAH